MDRPASGMDRLSAAYGTLLAALAGIAAALLFVMVAMICADVVLRNVALGDGPRGLPWSNEISEQLLFLMTMLAAPWLLRRGAHIRVDIVLRALPDRLGWACEWIADILALACCVFMTFYGLQATIASVRQQALSIKTLVMPEWWLLAPLPVAFALVAVEVLFRMRRLAVGPRAPRDDAVSAS